MKIACGKPIGKDPNAKSLVEPGSDGNQRGRPNSADRNNLPQAEWDFRTISTDDLTEAILYEYARSADWVRQEFDAWHKQIIHLPKASKNLCKWNGKTVKEVLHFLDHQW